MSQPSIGLLETKGLVPLIYGTDAMLKAADVELAGPMKGVGSGLVSATIHGDVAAVKAALDSGAEAANQIGEVVSAHVIARPQQETIKILPAAKAGGAARKSG
ncbi:MAG: BMC domain-containing protein [Puniceicoccaceae bacterium]